VLLVVVVAAVAVPCTAAATPSCSGSLHLNRL
jgi:hypothetical protein